MTEANANALSQTPLWQVEALRFTCFLSSNSSSGIDPSSWFEEAVGEPATKQNNQPKAKIFEEEGPFAGGKLVLSRTPGRVDWLLVGDPATGTGVISLPEPFIKAVETFRDMSAKWIAIAPIVTRMAVGATLLVKVLDRAEGYRVLTKYVRSLNLEGDVSDLLYRINRPRPSHILRESDSNVLPFDTESQVTPVTINRLSTWMVAIQRRVNFQLSDITGKIAPDSSVSDETASIYARCEVDVNTVSQLTGAISANQRVPAITELYDMVREIAEKGDVA